MRCKAANCTSKGTKRGMCHKHYMRWLRHGNTETVLSRAPHTHAINYGKGWSDPRGYKLKRVNGRQAYEHVHIAERVLGRRLKKQECVHHWGDITDNTKLVICPNQLYHMLLHERARRLK